MGDQQLSIAQIRVAFRRRWVIAAAPQTADWRVQLEGSSETAQVSTCSRVLENPTERLQSAAYRKIVAELRGCLDLGIVDSPLLATSPLILVPQVWGAWVVVDRSTMWTGIHARSRCRPKVKTNPPDELVNEFLDVRDESRRRSSQPPYRPNIEAVNGARGCNPYDHISN